MNTNKDNVDRIVDAIDFARACSEAGGAHEHAFDLLADRDELQRAADELDAFRERIIRELESASASQ